MSETHESKDFGTSPQARGKRVQSLRGLTRLSRREFKERYGIPASSLQNWEDAIGNGLSEKGARKLIAALKSDGIHCTFEWLMYGLEPAPQLLSNSFFISSDRTSSVKPANLNEDEQLQLILAELLIFRKHYPNTAIDLVVSDDGMEPRYIRGEHVAGVKRHHKDIQEAIGQDCIVQTSTGNILLRTLRKGDIPDRYHLVCSNQNTTVDKPILYDVELLCAAPVIWTRRKDSRK